MELPVVVVVVVVAGGASGFVSGSGWGGRGIFGLEIGGSTS